MRKFIDLNRIKLKFAFRVSSLATLGLVSIFLAIAFFNNSFPDTALLLTIVFTAGIVFPLFILFLSYLTWMYRSNTRKKVLSKTPFDQIKTIGFDKSLSNVHSKWSFTEEVLLGRVSGFTLICDISQEKPHTIEFEAPVEWRQLDESSYRLLSERFERDDIELRVGSIVKLYNTKRQAVSTIHNLKSGLEQFTNLLKQEGFLPISENA